MSSDRKDQTTITGTFTIGSDPSGAEIPSLTRLLNRKSFKRSDKEPTLSKPVADAESPPSLAPFAPPVPGPATPPAPSLQVRSGRRNASVAQLREAAKPTFVASWDPARLTAVGSQQQIPWLSSFAELWKKESSRFGGALFIVFRAKGDQWNPVLVVGEPAAMLSERGALLEGFSWSESSTPGCFQQWKQRPSEGVDLEESSVPVPERAAIFAALGLGTGERASLLPARLAAPKELCVVVSKGRLPKELVAASAAQATPGRKAA